MAEERQSKASPIRWCAAAICLAVAATLALFSLVELKRDPRIAFLWPEGGARWIRLSEPAKIMVQPGGEYAAVFRKRFTLDQAPDKAALTLRAFKHAKVLFDGVEILETSRDLDTWKRAYRVDLAPLLKPGLHEIQIATANKNGPACALAYCEALGVRTGADWEASRNREAWTPARCADASEPFEYSREFPRADAAFAKKLPWLVPVFMLAAALALYGARWKRYVTPGAVRWALLAAWVVLAINDAFKVPLGQGFDIDGHCLYVQYVAENKNIPLATEGWQMFQSPLYYLLAAPLLKFLQPLVSLENAYRSFRIITLLSGIGQVEIAYRMLRRLFPEHKDAQIMGTLVGGLLPMNLYMSQCASNEPLAGFLIGLTILLMLRWMQRTPEQRAWPTLIGIGAALGLAALAKVTAVLLLIPLFFAVAYGAFSQDAPPLRCAARAIRDLAAVVAIATLIAGWYYLRNYLFLGRPFIGGWEAARDIVWWQDPGYRTPSDFLRFGEALVHPVYAGLFGFWDGLYSTMWFDGYLSASVEMRYCPPWNFGWAFSCVWLSLLPTLAIGIGLVGAVRSPSETARSGLLFAAGCVGVFFAALVLHAMTNPSYCAIKTFYSLGATCCYAALAAAGFDWLTRRRKLRAAVYGTMACWAVSAYAGYFVW